MRLRPDTEDDTEVDLAPLIDCVFLLLIFFLVATQLSEFEDHLEFTLPPAKTALAATRSREVVEIALQPDGRVQFHGRQLMSPRPQHALPAKTPDDVALSSPLLNDRLAALAREFPEDELWITAHPDTPFEHVVTLVDRCKLLGLERLEVRTFNVPGDFMRAR